ncbi:MAG: PDZ domain-containing protein, partial [Bacteroidia bacterium]|nr:PDZ domain-containing protein [Bacteroidia bacterium]
MDAEIRLQALRIELEEKERLIDQLRRQWEAERASQAARLKEAVAQQWEEALQQLAPALAYLATQQGLWAQGTSPPLSAVFQNLERLWEGWGQVGIVRWRAEGEGIRVEEVLPGSAADEAGIGPGDFLLLVEGTPARNIPTDFWQSHRQATLTW